MRAVIASIRARAQKQRRGVVIKTHHASCTIRWGEGCSCTPRRLHVRAWK